MSISVITVQFQETEYAVDESVREKQVHFIITNPIIVDTHFLVLAQTYQQFDEQYEALNTRYPGLDPFTLNDEYDQAERKHMYTSECVYMFNV